MHFTEGGCLAAHTAPLKWRGNPSSPAPEGLGLGTVTSAFGPMNRSPSRAPAITRMCFGRPTLQGHRRSVSWAGACLCPRKLQSHHRALEGGCSEHWKVAQGKGQSLDPWELEQQRGWVVETQAVWGLKKLVSHQGRLSVNGEDPFVAWLCIHNG